MVTEATMGAGIVVAPEIWIGLGGLVLHAIAIASAGIWQLSKVRTDLLSALADHRSEVQKQLDDDRKAIAETLLALRQKINDVENDGLKTYVRRDSFHEIVNRIGSENQSFKELVEARFDRADAKIDRLIERVADIRN